MKQRGTRVLTSPRENWRTIGKVLITIALVLAIAPFIAHVYPGLLGADQSYVVLSGSMEPNVSVGSVIFVETDISAQQIDEGDVITFTKGSETRTTTHRVHEKRTATVNNETSISFITKGDANEEPDQQPVYRDDIVGRMKFSIPLVGYVVAFAGTDLGWFTLFVVPVFLLFADGLLQLYRAIEFEDTDE